MIRVPRMHAFPWQISGFVTILSRQFIFTLWRNFVEASIHREGRLDHGWLDEQHLPAGKPCARTCAPTVRAVRRHVESTDRGSTVRINSQSWGRRGCRSRTPVHEDARDT